jgi:hypothetical protein
LVTVRNETVGPNTLDLLTSGIRSDTEALAPRFVSGELVGDLDPGDLIRRAVRIVTATDSYDEERIYMAFGAGEELVDVTDVLRGFAPVGFFTDANFIASESRSSGSMGLETSDPTQNDQTALTREQSGRAPEVIEEEPPELNIPLGATRPGRVVTEFSTANNQIRITVVVDLAYLELLKKAKANHEAQYGPIKDPWK